MPFFYRKNENGSFAFEIAGSKHGWSLEALKWLNFMSFDERFRKNQNEQYQMKCSITGEKEVEIEGHRYKIDGVVETPEKTYFLEFFGCR